MPITLYLKYDPLVVLSENTEKSSTTDVTNGDNNDNDKTTTKSNEDEKNENKDNDDDDNTGKKEESCNYWRLLQDDIYRWAVDQRYEYWLCLEECDVYTMPAIQSPIIEENIITYYHNKENKKLIQQRLSNPQDKTELKCMQSFVVEDEYYKS